MLYKINKKDIVFYLFCTKYSSLIIVHNFFENFAINAQINVSFTLDNLCETDMEQKWILTKKTMTFSYCFS